VNVTIWIWLEAAVLITLGITGAAWSVMVIVGTLILLGQVADLWCRHV
jgi:hypothetical protein